MFKQLFTTMNEVLDEMIRQYPTADEVKKHELADQFHVLKAMSDTCIEEWLLFEEKMAELRKLDNDKSPVPFQGIPYKELETTECHSEAFKKGEGYFKLLMYDNAIREFEDIVEQQPDFVLARLYLALGYLQNGEIAEAYRHFQFIIPMSVNSKIKAISLNALGCIQFKNQNMDKAYEYFKLAFKTDPTLQDPLINMGVCLHNEGSLQCSVDLIH